VLGWIGLQVAETLMWHVIRQQRKLVLLLLAPSLEATPYEPVRSHLLVVPIGFGAFARRSNKSDRLRCRTLAASPEKDTHLVGTLENRRYFVLWAKRLLIVVVGFHQRRNARAIPKREGILHLRRQSRRSCRAVAVVQGRCEF
jgi:hypothetical protein